MYNTIFESILLYAAKTWTANKANENKLLTTKMDYSIKAARTSKFEKKTDVETRIQLNVKTNITQNIDGKDGDGLVMGKGLKSTSLMRRSQTTGMKEQKMKTEITLER